MTPAEEESLQEAQAFADAIASAYGFPRVQLVVRETSSDWTGLQVSYVSPSLLASPSPVRDLGIAMLLGFRVVKPAEPRSESDEERINRTVYPLRNLAALDILVEVKGLPQEVAAEQVHTFLVGQARAMFEKRLGPPRGMPHPCIQLRSFVERLGSQRFEPPEWCPPL